MSKGPIEKPFMDFSWSALHCWCWLSGVGSGKLLPQQWSPQPPSILSQHTFHLQVLSIFSQFADPAQPQATLVYDKPTAGRSTRSALLSLREHYLLQS